MNILHITGMPFPTKYGSLEQWFAEICRQASISGYTVYIAYTQRADDVKLYNEKMTEYGGKLVVLRDDNEIESFCKRQKIDILHLHFYFCGHKPLYRRLNKHGVRLFVHYHGENGYYVNQEWKSNIRTWIRINGHRLKMRYTSRFFEQFFGCSKIVADQHKTFYRLPDNKVSVHYLGINRDDNASREKIHSIPIITCTAFHSPVKGVDVLLEALALLKSRGVPFRFIQIGGGSSELNGEDTAELKKQCDSLGLTEHVHWTGVINNVRDYLRNTDIYCQPSRSEAIPLSIAEAMQYGIPVVATNVGGVSELVRDGENGFLLVPDDPQALADKLQLLIESREQRELMGALSKNILNDLNFFQDQSASSLLEIYKSEHNPLLKGTD
jgi:glycosyltransferase involved in cell wall biosynthesis